MTIKKLEDMATYFYEVRKAFITDANDIFLDNLFVNSILIRAYQINKGFILLRNDGNFLSACPLVRMQLETLLRCYGALISDGDTYIHRFISGKKVDNLTYKGKQLTYTYLVNLIAEDINAPQLPRIYNEGNRYVHPTDYTYKASIWKKDTTVTIQNLEGELYEESEMKSIEDDMMYVNVCYIPVMNRYLDLYYANVAQIKRGESSPVSDEKVREVLDELNTILNISDRG